MIDSIVTFIGILVIIFFPVSWYFSKLKMNTGDEICLTLLGLMWSIGWLVYFITYYDLIFKIITKTN